MKTLLGKFMGTYSKGENNSEWFFISYSPSDFPLKSKFDLFFLSSNKSIPKYNSPIVIENVYDSFGNLLREGIPKGYKTVCQFTFTNGIPKEFQELPVLKGWKPSAEEILIISLESFEFNVFPELLDDLIKIIIVLRFTEKLFVASTFSALFISIKCFLYLKKTTANCILFNFFGNDFSKRNKFL